MPIMELNVASTAHTERAPADPMEQNDDRHILPEMPSAEAIMKRFGDAEPVNLVSQEADPYFAEIIAYLRDGVLPPDTASARRVIFRSETYTIMNDQLIKLNSFRRKRRTVINPVQKQLCLGPAHRLTIMCG